MSSVKPVGSITAITGDTDLTKAIHVFPASLQPYRSTVLAYGASFVGTIIGFPLDTVKTRMQTHKNYTSYFDCISKTYTKEGTRGFFRGIWAPLISTSFSKSLSVSIFTQAKPMVYQLLYPSSSDTSRTVAHPFIRNIPVCFFSGCLAGGGVSLYACPFEFTKIYAQIEKVIQNKSLKDAPMHLQAANSNFKSSSTMEIVKRVIHHEGPKGLYSGFKYHFMRDALSSGIYYSVYESLKWAMNTLINKDASQSSQISILLAGGLAGVLCWTCIFPIDTTKSLIQRDVVTNIMRKQQGLEPFPHKERKLQRLERGHYRGLGISVTRSFIVNMVFFSAFEVSMAHIV